MRTFDCAMDQRHESDGRVSEGNRRKQCTNDPVFTNAHLRPNGGPEIEKR